MRLRGRTSSSAPGRTHKGRCPRRGDATRRRARRSRRSTTRSGRRRCSGTWRSCTRRPGSPPARGIRGSARAVRAERRPGRARGDDAQHGVRRARERRPPGRRAPPRGGTCVGGAPRPSGGACRTPSATARSLRSRSDGADDAAVLVRRVRPDVRDDRQRAAARRGRATRKAGGAAVDAGRRPRGDGARKRAPARRRDRARPRRGRRSGDPRPVGGSRDRASSERRSRISTPGQREGHGDSWSSGCWGRSRSLATTARR